MRDVEELLEELVPSQHDPCGDWPAVLRDARRTGRRRAAFPLGAGTLVVVAALIAVLAWPFAGDDLSVTERALVAVGEQHVLHVVFEEPSGRTLLDLETGERRTIYPEREVWFDPKRGFRTIERLGGVVESDYAFDAARAEGETFVYREFATGYRAALAAGKATVVAEETVGGEAVYWIRIEGSVWRDRNDPLTGGPAVYATEVAVSRETFRPLYVRRTINGKPRFGRPEGARVLMFETLPAGQGRFRRERPQDDGVGYASGYAPPMRLHEAKRVLGRPPVWAGPAVEGLPFVQTRTRTIQMNPDTPEQMTLTGVGLFYGTLEDDGSGPFLDKRKRHIVIELFRRAHPAALFEYGVYRYVPPEGSILISGGRRGVVRAGGLVVGIVAPNEEHLLAAARALRPYP
jgi:hypothetical protein